MNLHVQHCNRFTHYRLIHHEFNPADCINCRILIAINDGDVELTKQKIHQLNELVSTMVTEPR